MEHLSPFTAEPVAVLKQIAEAERLDGEGHVHDLCGVPVAGGEVDEPALGQDMDRPSVFEGI